MAFLIITISLLFSSLVQSAPLIALNNNLHLSNSSLSKSIHNKGYIGLSDEEKISLVSSHDRAFQALDETIRDPFITKGPDGVYYLTGTTAGSHWGNTVGIRLWRSNNLANWEDMGFVWELNKEGKQQVSWHWKQPIKQNNVKNPLAIWAPEIHYINNTWWIPHSLNVSGHGLLKSTSGKPEGPYESLPPFMLKNIDSHLFQEPTPEGNGEIYYLWQADYIAKMNSSMTSFAETPVKLEHKGNHEIGYEGILLMKFENKYLHIASGRYGYESSDTYDLYYAVSNNIMGPYDRRRMLIKNAGHGNLFQGPNDKWWSTAFDHEYTTSIDKKNRWSLWLIPIDITVTTDDVVIHVKDPRFSPTQQDHEDVKQLAITGKPELWQGKAPWTTYKQLTEAQ